MTFNEWASGIAATIKRVLREVRLEIEQRDVAERERLHLAQFNSNPRTGHKVCFYFSEDDVVEKDFESVFKHQSNRIGILFKFNADIEAFIAERHGHKEEYSIPTSEYAVFMIERGKTQPGYHQVIMFPYVDDAIEFKLRFM